MLGKDCFGKAISEMENIRTDDGSLKMRIEKAETVLEKNAFPSDFCILDILKNRLSEHGYIAEESETYLRGGSVSWMMLGDISAEPYKTEKAEKVRKELILLAEKILAEYGGLESLGTTAINIPFHGARGIKFVLKGNDKERGTRDLIERMNISPDSMIFAGNELFHGGNDNMIRNIDGVTLLSVGEKTDPGKNVFYGGNGTIANRRWMETACRELERGVPWPSIICEMKMAEVSDGRCV